MPEKLLWTAPRDTQLKRLRAEGMSWDAIAAAIGVSRNAAIERGRRLGARLPPPEYRPEPEDPERPPLPPGDPRTWGAIVAGTCLEGTPYPLPLPSAAPQPAQPRPVMLAASPPASPVPDRARVLARPRLTGAEPAAAEPPPG